MKCTLCTVLLTLFIIAPVSADAPDERTYSTAPAVRFMAVDVFVDSGEHPLAAYQFELTDPANRAKIVGLEGGQHAAFSKPPYYDPAALMHNRVIVAAFNTNPGLPTGNTRVCRVHLQITGNVAPAFQINLQTAATANGNKIAAKISIKEGDAK